MSEQWPQLGSESADRESEAQGSFSQNGAGAEDAGDAAAGSAEDAVATSEAPADETATTSGDAEEASLAESADDPTAAATAAEPADAVDGSTFQNELLRAIRTTAGLERIKTNEDAERRRQSHVDLVRAREASEADRMRQLAADDMAEIEAWADAETKRIQLERERRASELNRDLEMSLAEHHAKIDHEIDAVELAIASYRTEVGVFFDELDRETDLVLIAQQAARRPEFPTLDGIGAMGGEAPAAATPGDEASGAGPRPAEPAVVGVMDPAAPAEPAEAWTAPSEPSSEAAEPAEPVGAAPGASQASSGPLIQSVPVSRPMSWLRRESNSGDRSDR
jgi:hypothetical protein